MVLMIVLVQDKFQQVITQSYIWRLFFDLTLELLHHLIIV